MNNMENLDLNAKKAEVLSDEELMKVCGGEDPMAQAMLDAKKAMCTKVTDEKECRQMDFCTWKVFSNTYRQGTCHYKG